MDKQPTNARVNVLRRLTLSAMKIVYDPQASGQLVASMKQGDPAHAIARAAQMIVKRLHEAFGQAPKEALNAVAPIVAALLMDLASAAGVMPQDESILAKAIGLLLPGKKAPAPAKQPAPQAQPMPPQGGLINQAGA